VARRISAFAVAGLASIGAGVVHATAAGMHAEHELLTRLFVATAAAQVLIGALVLLRAGRLTAIGTAIVNGAAVVAWAITRVADISWIGGLEQAEAPQFADTACAAFGVIATVAALVALRPAERTAKIGTGLIAPAVAIAAVTVAAMLATASHVHSHDESEAAHEHTGEDAAGAHDHATEAATTETTAHSHGDEAATADHEPTGDAAAAAHEHTDDATPAQAVAAAAWPRPWDPTQPIDFSGVPGVTPEQQARAEGLVKATLEQLPQFADVSTLPALGYRSIGDASTGHEHYINMGYIVDDAFLDPSKPESLVYAVDGDQRTLVSAMFIANDRPIDDPELVDFGGGLMQWHVHENLCWGLNDAGEPVVVGLTDADGNCAPPSVHAGGNNPMVHVWIAPHECGPFAALEGHGAGQTGDDGPRVDQCAHEGHGDHAAAGAAVAPVPYDPTKPIDLSGVEGVTPEQQAYAENLVAVTVIRLPQWSDPAVAEAAGFHSIGDAGTGHEHYVQWDWINDDVWLDPDAPESLVYEPQPDGSKKLVSAMYMLPTSVALEDVPNYGGALMQWHIHDNLCYTNDPVAPQVAGLTRGDGSCRPPLVKHDEAAMIHVWITPHQCGPFAALEGVGAGTVPAGEEQWCDHAHGS